MAESIRSVLVVTDDERTVDEITYGMPEGFQAVMVADSRAASRKMLELSPAVVIAKIRTGSAGGFGLLTDMSQRARLEKIPVLMLLEREQDEWLAKQAGATATLVQPVEGTTLVSAALALVTNGAPV